MEQAEAYKVTTVDAEGNEIVAYVTPKQRHMYVSSMNSEYGNATVEPISIADLPEGVTLGE